MRDLELRGAGDLLGDEQSGHVAAIGFELYVAMLDEAVEALRAQRGEAEGEGEADRPPRHRRRRLPARRLRPLRGGEDRRPPADRRRPARPGELRALRDELRDRFGPVARAGREPARRCSGPGSTSARAGARTAEVRGGRLSVIPLELDAATVGRLRERIPEAIFELRTRTLLAAGRRRPAASGSRRCSSSPTRWPPRWPPSRSPPERAVLSLPLAGVVMLPNP